ncbi:MAG: nucleotidyl transferase AbiEii/AbiGii toxin family protein [Prevotellaceae bacterium]|jgi:predicted nucleotidyltransferase component of viral defense system|nr:nucleotidyl transferase AbiEii/AbiGii toxin family protein [Prevotellaceae bacterium]
MINKSEINRLATVNQVATSTIDKDWALGHFVDALFSVPECREELVFKGGTCIKKCRIPDYRFSEDIDFTAKNESFVFDRSLLEKITDLITERTDIPLFIQSIDELRFNNRRTGYVAQVKYWGADHRKDQHPPEPSRWLTSIKIEIILYELLVFEAEKRNVYHPYSDKLTENAQNIPVYNIHEMLAEKIRALIQRSYTAPRDYYDIWFLSKNIENVDWKMVTEAFYAKTAYKKLQFSGIEQLINNENDRILKAAWNNSLKHQVSHKNLPEYDVVREDLFSLFQQLFK